MAKVKLTKARYEEIQAELYRLQTDGEKEAAEKIKEARAFGDLSENSEYDEAKNEQGKLYSRIAELKDMVDNAEIIQEISAADKVVLGAIVTVYNHSAAQEKTYRIVGTREANPRENRLSDESPIGRALMDHRVGDTVEAETPVGKVSLEILKLEV
jgi:transcription elongation factor GreA